MNKRPKVIGIAAGGTGGHIIPAIAIARELQRINPSNQIVVFAREKGELDKALWSKEKVSFIPLPIDTLGFWPPLKSIKSFNQLLKCKKLVANIIENKKFDIILSFGGYVSAPVVWAAKNSSCPLYLHEQNTIPGRVNRIASKWAKHIFLTYNSSGVYFPNKTITVAGMPIRKEALIPAIPRKECYGRFLLSPDKFTVLVFGGSQGARSLCKIVPRLYEILSPQIPLQILVQTGTANQKIFSSAPTRKGIYVYEFFSEIGYAYAIADVVICRAGASSLAEMAINSKAAIIVPYLYAKDNHQYYNAREYSRVNAAILIEEKKLSPDNLAREIMNLYNNPEKKLAMEKRINKLINPDATKIITEQILKEINSNQG